MVDFVSFYVELPIMLGMFLAWKVFKRTKFVRRGVMDLVTDRYDLGRGEGENVEEEQDVQQGSTGLWRRFGGGERGGKIAGKVKKIGMWLFF